MIASPVRRLTALGGEPKSFFLNAPVHWVPADTKPGADRGLDQGGQGCFTSPECRLSSDRPAPLSSSVVVPPALGVGSVAVGLNSVITRRPAYAASSDDAKWKQYSGSKLVFMSENTPPSFAIRENLKPFYDLTGIEVEILTDDLPVVQQKVGIDLRGGKADFHLNYVQDKPIGAPFADFYANLLDFTGDDTLPQDPEGYGQEVWFENFLDRLRLDVHARAADRLPLRLRGRLHLLPAGPVRAAARTSRRNMATGWSSRRTRPGSSSTSSPPSSRSCATPARTCLRPAPRAAFLDHPARHPAHLFSTASGPSSTSTTSWARKRRGRPIGVTSSRS